jgi:transcriptional/translational regulatory protein YebC/TACO1
MDLSMVETSCKRPILTLIAFKKATSKSTADNLEDVIYEGYGPGGVAMIM